jgi:uncharacterized protein YqgV (UPF0045/DUF77 family)
MEQDNNQIMNAAIQVVPLEKSATAMEMIDRSIEIIQKSGMNYSVSAFETNVDGTWEDIISLLTSLRNQLKNETVEDALINVKFQWTSCGSISSTQTGSSTSLGTRKSSQIRSLCKTSSPSPVVSW